MHATRNIRKRDSKEDVGLAAIGSVGGWEVSLDETTSGVHKWSMQIEGPKTYVSFAVRSPEVVGRMLAFLTTTKERQSEILIGKSEREPLVTLVRDDEFSDRFFLVGESKKNLLFRMTIGGEDLKSFAGALQQAQEELDEAEVV